MACACTGRQSRRARWLVGSVCASGVYQKATISGNVWRLLAGAIICGGQRQVDNVQTDIVLAVLTSQNYNRT